MTKNKYIRFDWAMKRLLRNKVNFGVLEGLLTTLLGERITIQKMLESESNQADEYDKYNRVDILAENSKGEIILIEGIHQPGGRIRQGAQGLQREHCLFHAGTRNGHRLSR